MGDYSSCLTDTVDGQYMIASISGNYNGSYAFDRGVFGKYIPNFAT
jgi:hypothetical protein